MIRGTTPIPRSGSVARPIMKDSHSFDSGSNPDRSTVLLVMVLYYKFYYFSWLKFFIKSDSRTGSPIDLENYLTVQSSLYEYLTCEGYVEDVKDYVVEHSKFAKYVQILKNSNCLPMKTASERVF